MPCGAVAVGFYFACRRCGDVVTTTDLVQWFRLVQSVLGDNAFKYWHERYKEEKGLA